MQLSIKVFPTFHSFIPETFIQIDLQMICMTFVMIQQLESANIFLFSGLILGGQSADLHKEISRVLLLL